ncbi:hypothetical protein [Romboutsia timonensis]|uniref:hypothetical protein n=1 Tax=Romboutsia timonensis TaxID=1776391 RepID=UPI0008DB0A25|nr:hypothetical protein [Romboutsia timonensis]
MKKIEIPKIENLKVGQVIKNYKKLCNLLEIKTRTGEAKQIQLERLRNAIDYHKEGHKFVIDKIKEIDEIEFIDKRALGNNSETSIEIGDVILHKLLTEYCGQVVTITSNELLVRLMLMSKEYKKFLYETDAFRCEIGINYEYLRKYRLKIGTQLNKRIESALKRLKNSGYIYYNQKIHLRLIKENGEHYNKVLDDNRDIEIFLDTKFKALDILNCLRVEEGKSKIDDTSKLMLFNEFKRFSKIVCELLSKEFDDKCITFWEGYIINTTRMALKRVVDDRKYNQNIDYIKNNFYELLENTTRNIREEEIKRLQSLHKEVYEEESNDVMWGEPTFFRSNDIEFEIKNILKLSKILVG